MSFIRISRLLAPTSVQLQLTYKSADIVAALQHADRYSAYSAKSFRRILELRFAPGLLKDRLAWAAKDQVRETMGLLPVQLQAPSEYARLLGASAKTTGDEDDHADDESTP